MDYYLEIWLRDLPKNMFKGIRIRNIEQYHPHITLVRPFSVWNLHEVSEDHLKKLISGFCEGKKPIPFAIEGKGRFENKDGTYYYFPVVDSGELIKFNDGLERALKDYVQFAEKLDDEKIFHMTVDTDLDIPPSPRIDQHMLRLTAMRNMGEGNDIIWFSYDFFTQRLLERNEAKDRYLWQKTLREFYAEN